jgi:putative ABC transport system permease protein
MKYLHLITGNLLRNKMRSLLTVGLMAAIFFLVATLIGILDNFERVNQSGSGDRLVVQSEISLANMLPFADETRIRQIPGVLDTAKTQWNGGYYKSERNQGMPILAIDHDKLKSVFPDYRIDPKQMADFEADRRGAVVGKDLMTRFGWKIGDRIVIHRQYFPLDPDLTIRAVSEHDVINNIIYFHMDYFQQSIGNWGRSGTIWVKVKNPADMPAISQQIDAMFKNSDDPTETMTESEFNRQFLAMMGNIKLLFGAVSTSAIFMVVLLAAITMSMSARERVTEIAVLKAIGFQRGLILTLMLTEFVILTLIGGALGAWGAKIFFMFFDLSSKTQGMLIDFVIGAHPIAVCMIAAAAVGLIAGGFPAMRSANLSVVDGLRKVV